MPTFIEIYKRADGIYWEDTSKSRKNAYSIVLRDVFPDFNVEVLDSSQQVIIGNNSYTNSSNYYHFKLNGVCYISDSRSAEFSIQKMQDEDDENNSSKYKELIEYIKPFQNIEFNTSERLESFFKEHNLELYLNTKLKTPASLGVFERLKRFNQF